MIEAKRLGSQHFCTTYGLRYPYVAGSMYKGIGSKALVVRMGRAGLLGFFGTGGLRLPVIAEAIDYIQRHLSSIPGSISPGAYGMNLLCHLEQPDIELSQIELFLAKGVHYVEAAAFMQMTPALVLYRLKGLRRTSGNGIIVPNRIMGKVSRPEVAKHFMSPAPEAMVRELLASGNVSQEEAELSQYIPMSHDICVEADSGGHTDQGVAYALMPAMLRLRDELQARYRYGEPMHIGAAGGIGTPEAVAAAFTLGADFIVTGSINQCSVEADTSEAAKEMLQGINVQDTAYAPAGDMFEIGARVQVLRKGVFFPARANKLYDLYKHFDSIESIDETTQKQLQEKYFKRSFADVWEETRAYYQKNQPEALAKAERHPKSKMALIFRWYFIYSGRLTRDGVGTRVDYQIHTGPALGAFNQWVKGTAIEDWRHRHVDDMAERLMVGAAQLLNERVAAWTAVDAVAKAA